MGKEEVKYIKTLDGWRAIAVIGVILSHFKDSLLTPSSIFYPIFAVGINGVDLFFAISGYLIGSHLLHELDKNNTIDLRQFYIKRFFRLMPTAWFYLLVIWLMSPSLITVSDIEIFSSLTFWRNYLRFAGFAPEIPSYTAQYWSLMVEEHFYFFLPGFLLLMRKPRRILTSIVVIGILVAIWRKLGTMAGPTAIMPFIEYDSWFTFGRFDNLLYGVLLALLQKYYPRVIDQLKKIPPYLPGAAIIILFAIKVPFRPILEALIYPLIFFTTINHESSYLSRMLENPVLRYLGTISYSLYIWHVLFMHHFEQGPTWFRVLGAGWHSLLIILAISALSYHLIENPSRKIGKKVILQMKLRRIVQSV